MGQDSPYQESIDRLDAIIAEHGDLKPGQYIGTPKFVPRYTAPEQLSESDALILQGLDVRIDHKSDASESL